MSSITLVFEISNKPEISLVLNGQLLEYTIDRRANQHGHICLTTNTDLAKQNVLSVIATNVDQIKLVEILVDDIRFGFVTFLCTTIDGQQQTQLTVDGQIDIELSTPIWEFWCQKMNSFNYKDYPLGSTN
jgi:hypothetical protein